MQPYVLLSLLTYSFRCDFICLVHSSCPFFRYPFKPLTAIFLTYLKQQVNSKTWVSATEREKWWKTCCNVLHSCMQGPFYSYGISNQIFGTLEVLWAFQDYDKNFRPVSLRMVRILRMYGIVRDLVGYST